MYYDGQYTSGLVASVQSLYATLIGFLPRLLVAIIWLILGWIIGILLGELVFRILAFLKIDMLANRLGMDKLSERSGRNLSIARLGQWLVKWFFIVAFFAAAVDTLGLSQAREFLFNSVVPYFGNVLIAVIILLIGIMAANFLSDLVKGMVSAGRLAAAGALSSITRWAILAFAIIAALSQLNVATSFLQDMFRAIVAMLAIAGGLAFGLGGRDHAKKWLDKIENDLSR